MENNMIVKDKTDRKISPRGDISPLKIEPTLHAALGVVGTLEIASKLAEAEGDKFPKGPLAVHYSKLHGEDLYYLRKATKDNPYFKID